MCGIAGAFRLGSRAPIDPRRIESMGEALAHRGPDGDGVFHGPGVGLAHRRLSIVDVAHGAQPMRNGKVVVVSNGEIYNHVALREELSPLGHRYQSHCDTEAIVHAFEQWGPDCGSHFNGKFAFAAYDERTDELVLVRDRLGVKPLCYTVASIDGDRYLLFASEIKGIIAFGGVATHLDAEAIEDSLLVGFVLGERTAFKDIRRLQAGSALVVRRDGLRPRKYWDLRFSPRAGDGGADPASAVAAALEASVKDRLMSDVPIAACLSGGLDSSIIVALAQRNMSAPIRTVAIRFQGGEALNDRRVIEGLIGDDVIWARRVAEYLGTDHQELDLARDDYLEGLDQAIWHREKPLFAPAEFGLLRVAKAVKPFASVLLSGQGADEIFGGYYYWTSRRDEANTPFFPWVFKAFGTGEYTGAHAASELFAALLGPTRAARAWTRLRQEFKDWMARAETDAFDQKMLYLMVKLHLVEQLEHEDALKMAHGVELRVPFVDHRVIELVAGLPPSKAGDALEKPLLRRVGGALLPADVAARKKSPFPHPIGIDEEEAAMRDALARTDTSAFLDRAAARRFLDDYVEPVSYAKRQVLFKMYTFDRFSKLFGVA